MVAGPVSEVSKTWGLCEVTCRSRGSGLFTSCIILGRCIHIQVCGSPLWSQPKFLRPHWAPLAVQCAFVSAWHDVVMSAVFPVPFSGKGKNANPQPNPTMESHSDRKTYFYSYIGSMIYVSDRMYHCCVCEDWKSYKTKMGEDVI